MTIHFVASAVIPTVVIPNTPIPITVATGTSMSASGHDIAGGVLPGVGGVVSGVGGVVNGITGGIVDLGADSAMGALSQWVADGAVWFLDQVGRAISATTSPDLGAGWFTEHYTVMAGLAALVVLPLTLVSLITSIVRQDGSIIVRCVLVNLPLSLVVTGVAVEVVRLSLASVDALCNAVSAGTGATLVQLFTSMEQWMSSPLAVSSGGAAPMFVVFVLSAVAAFASLVLWIEMALRSACVYVAVLFLPLAFSGLVLPATIPWCRRLIETIAALIVSKLVVVATLSLAVSAMGSSTGTVSDVVEGCAMLLLAAFAPFALLRLIPVVEAGAASHLEGLSRRAIAAVPVSEARTGLQMALAAGTGGSAPMVGAVGATPMSGSGDPVHSRTVGAGAAPPGGGSTGAVVVGDARAAGTAAGNMRESRDDRGAGRTIPGGQPGGDTSVRLARRTNPLSHVEMWLSAGGFREPGSASGE